MTKPNFRLVTATLMGAVALVFCSLLAHADGYGFSPPTGWRAQHAPAGYTGLWVNPAAQEAVNLLSTPAGSLSGLVQRQMQKSRTLYPSMQVYSNVSYHVCGRHEGRYLIWTAVSHGSPWIHEQVMANWQDNGLVASYVRPGNAAPSRAARASIVSICGVAGGSLNNPSAPQPAAAPAQPAQPDNNPATTAPAGPATATPYGYPSLAPRYVPVIPT